MSPKPKNMCKTPYCISHTIPLNITRALHYCSQSNQHKVIILKDFHLLLESYNIKIKFHDHIWVFHETISFSINIDFKLQIVNLLVDTNCEVGVQFAILSF